MSISDHPDIDFTDRPVLFDFENGTDSYLYNQNFYLSTKFKNEYTTYSMVNNKTEKLIGQINFQIKNDKAISLPESPFGFFEIVPDIDVELLSLFVEYFIKKLKADHVKIIEIRSYAQGYNASSFSMLNYLLWRHNFTTYRSELNHHIPIKGSYREKLNKMELRKLKKCEGKELIFNELPSSDLKNIYEFISKCRKQKGHDKLSLSFEELRELTIKFPEKYKSFVVADTDQWIAAVVAVVVSNKVLYNFYPAHLSSFNELSPMVYMISKIYEYGRVNNFSILDLGTSELSQGPNYGLIRFKGRVGGIPSVKLTYRMVLD